MKRAAVLIGFKKTENLPKLEAASASVVALEKRARDQGLGEEFIREVTDDNEPVIAQQIKD
jgi:hypothetical protein